MNRSIYCLAVLLFFFSWAIEAFAQTSEWKLIHEGNRHFNQKQYNTARRYYNDALKIDENNPRARFNLGNVFLASGQDSLAIDNYNQAIKNETSPRYRSLAYHNKGIVLQRRAGATDRKLKQQLLKAAIAEYQQALREDPANDPARYNMVLCQKQLREEKGGGGGESDQTQPKPQQNQPLMNYSRQAEKQTRKKINAQPRQRGLEKNW